jgi:signal transduction histidine kinase/ActR/RegA family two-component response regulator
MIGACNHLAGLLDSQRDVLREQWSARAARHAGTSVLAERLPELLRLLSAELQTPETSPAASAALADPPRLPAGFDLETVVRDYGLLQRVVLELLEQASVPVSMRDVRRLGDWFIRAVAHAVAEHARSAPARVDDGRAPGDSPEDTQRSAGQPSRERRARGQPEPESPDAPPPHEERPAVSRRDEFLVLLAIELKSPLAVIGTALTLLEQANGDAVRSARYCETARRQMGQLMRLVDDLLDVARVKGGKVELIRQHVELGSVVQQALATARPILEARQHELQVTLAPGVFDLSGDGARLEQVIVNLLTNAAHDTAPGGSISVRLSRAETALGAEAVLSVRDTGRGIAGDQLDGVFELVPSIAPADGGAGGLGLGLGLKLVKYLVEMHGGQVTVSSAGEGQGSEFVVRLPLASEAGAGEPSSSFGRARPSPHQLRVVLVDDSADQRELLKECIEQLGHEVLLASDGIEALALIEETRPGLALIDVALPGMDGYAVARRVRGALDRHEIRLVALTGYGGPDVQQTAKSAGFDLQLTKPLAIDQLRTLLADSLDRIQP